MTAAEADFPFVAAPLLNNPIQVIPRRPCKPFTVCGADTLMRFTHSAHLGLLFLLPVALIGCGPNSTSTETVSTDTTSTTDNSTSDAKVTVVGDTGLQFSLPAKWTAKNEDGDITCISPDSGAAVTFFPEKDAATVDRVIEALRAAKAKHQNYKEDGAPASTRLGALDATEQTGSYDLKDGPYTWKIDTVKGKTLVVINSIFDNSAQNTADYKALMDSVKATA